MVRLDKFGIGALIIGIILVVGILHFVFMTPEAGGWTTDNLVKAIIVAIEGGIIWLGIILVILGLLLLLL